VAVTRHTKTRVERKNDQRQRKFVNYENQNSGGEPRMDADVKPERTRTREDHPVRHGMPRWDKAQKWESN
jgi:hypothetical protein